MMPFNPTFGGHSWTKTVLLRDAIVCQRHEKLIIETRCHVCVVMHNHTTELRNLPTGREEQNHFTPLSKEETPGSELPAQAGRKPVAARSYLPREETLKTRGDCPGRNSWLGIANAIGWA